jgi:dCTP deaminase
MAEIWDDWVPGALSRRQMKQLVNEGHVQGVSSTEFDPSAIDLHLSDEAYVLDGGSVKPFGSGFFGQLEKDGLAKRMNPMEEHAWVLERRKTYLFRLKESLQGLRGKAIWGQATAKSSVGRVDVLARLIVDGMKQYESFTPDELCPGVSTMYLEVTPITFSVMVRPGDSLNQLRFFYGSPEECEIDGKEIASTCLGVSDPEHRLTVDLRTVNVAGLDICGFRAAPQKGHGSIPLWKQKDDVRPDPRHFWEGIRTDKKNRVRIEADKFYILRSRQRLWLPSGIAVYARAIDEEIGEMRIHYAGFAHPFFGMFRNDDQRGTPLIFEVRGHNVEVNLRDDEVLARLKFFRMSEDLPPEAGDKKTAYGSQSLDLSKFFREWSTAPDLAKDESI